MNRYGNESVAAFHVSRRHAQLQDVVRECEEGGISVDDRDALARDEDEGGRALQVVRDLIYELASATNRDLAVDVLIHATGVAEFGRHSLRSYARRHGLSAEAFRLQVRSMRRRLALEPDTGH